MPPKKSNLNNARSRDAQRKRVERAHQSAEQITGRNAIQRIRTAQSRAQESQEQHEERLRQNIARTRAARKQHIAKARLRERQRQRTSSSLTRASFISIAIEYEPVINYSADSNTAIGTMDEIEIERYSSDHPEPIEPVLIKAEKELDDRYDRKPEGLPTNCHPEQIPAAEMREEFNVTEVPEKSHTASSIYTSENLKESVDVKIEIENHPEPIEPVLIKVEKELEDRLDGNPERKLNNCHPEQIPTVEMREQFNVTEVPQKSHTASSIYISEKLKESVDIKIEIENHPEPIEPVLIKVEKELEDRLDGNPERQLK